LVAVRFPSTAEIIVARILPYAVAICLAIGAAQAKTPRQRPPPATAPPAHVYLLRGFMNIFSLGMDDLAEKIRARGIAASVTNHADADSVVSAIVSRYASGDHGPIILVGHSLGADAVIAMAEALDRSAIPVALIVLFDGTASHAVPANVAGAVNFTLQYDLTPGVGFRGTISNVELRNERDMDHLYIDKAPALQAQALDYILKAAAPAKPNPPPRRH
jgi:hypothetical protein